MTARIEDVWPLSSAQQGLRRHSGDDVPVVQHVLELAGHLDPATLRAAAQSLVERHAGLRAGFPPGRPVQAILRAVRPPWREVDLTGSEPRDREAEADRPAREDRTRAFDPTRPPLLRFTLVRLAPERHRLVCTGHRLIVDRRSMTVLLRELLTIYAAGGTGETLPRATAYRDHLELIALRDRAAAEAAWRKALAGLDEATLVAPAAVSGGRDVAGVELPGELSAALEPYVAGHGLTPETVLAGAWAVLLSRLTGRTDVVFGQVVTGRSTGLSGADTLVGPYADVVPLRVRLRPGRPVRELLADIQNDRYDVTPHEHLGLAAIEELTGIGPLFDTVTEYETDAAPPGPAEAGGLSVTSVSALDTDAYALRLTLVAGARLRLAYRSGAVDRDAAEALLHRFAEVLERMVADPELPVGRLEDLPDEAPPPDADSGSRAEDVWPLSPLQEGLLFHALYAGEGADVYVIQLSFDLDGPLDPARLRAAGRALLERHANLRAGFRVEGDRAVQVVARDVELPWREVDLTGRPETATTELLTAERTRRFEPTEPPLMRIALARLGADRHRLVLTCHHLLLDGWSLPLLARELFAVHEADGDAGVLPPVTPYREYLNWLATRDRAAAEKAWARALAGVTEPTLIASAAPAHVAVEPRTISRSLPDEPAGRLRAWARGRGLTLNTLVQGAWAVLLGRMTGRSDVVFGATVAGRPPELAGAETMLGLFINTVPVRVRLDPDRPLDAMLAELQDRQLALLPHQYLGLADIQRLAGVGTLFDTLLVYQNFPLPPEAVPEGELRVRPADMHDEVHYPLRLTVLPGPSLTLRLSYRPDLFDETAAVAMADRLVRLFAQVAHDPEGRIGEVDLLPPAERDRLVREWNDTVLPVPEATLGELFRERVRRSGDAVAVVFEDSSLTFSALDAAANRVAHRLVRAGVGPECVVGVCAERSLDLVVALLGVVRAGAAYVPLDPDYPVDRLRFMVTDSGASVVLTQRRFAGRTGTGVEELVLDDPGVWAPMPADDPGVAVDPGAVAYVIYTSGSTGRPKGVVNSHRGIVNRLSWMQAEFALSAGDTVLHKTPTSFDVSVWELFWPLLWGGRLVLAPPGGHRDPAALREVIEREKVTAVHFVPSMLAAFLADLPGDAAQCRSLRHVVCSGEELPVATARRCLAALPWAGVHNLYGPTEAAVDVTAWRCDREELAEAARVPIGRPTGNVRVYVLDERLRLAPVGVAGELYIGGVQVARGYHGRPGLTARRFVADPYGAPGDRLYATGDLVAWNSQGELEFLGRIDGQVKVRGFRIELGEIEAVLAEQPGVRDGAAAVRDDRLVAYVVGDLDVAALKRGLARRLPEHMVPAAFVALDALPLTPNGKLDRAALPAPDLTAMSSGRTPATPLEHRLCRLFADVLGLRDVGTDDGFFDLGGDSLRAVRLVAELKNAIEGSRVRVMDVFQHPTVRELAAFVQAGRAGPRSLLYELTGPVPPDERVMSYVCVPYGGGTATVFQPLADALPAGHSLYAVAIPGNDLGVEEDKPAIDELARLCLEEILGRVPGPMVLYGHCAIGGTLAIELARRLEAAGRTVEAVYVAGVFPVALPKGPLGWIGATLSDKLVSNRSLANWLTSMGVGVDDLDAAQVDRLAGNVKKDGILARDHLTRVLDSAPAHLKAPVISVVGDQDEATDFYRERYREWGFIADTVALVVLREAGHYFVRDRAAEVADIITGTHRELPEAPVDPSPPEDGSTWALEGLETRGDDHAPVRSEATPSVRRLFTVTMSQAVSLTGTALTSWSLPVWIYSRTGSLGWLGLAGILNVIPMLLSLPLAGAVADRADRRRVLMTAGCVAGTAELVLALLVWTGHLALGFVYVAMVLLTVVGTFQRITFTAAVPQLVPKRYLGNANGVVQMVNGLAVLVAPLLAAALLAAIGLGGILTVDIASYLVAIGALTVVRFPRLLGADRKEAFWPELLGGFRIFWSTRAFRALLVFSVVGNLIYTAPQMLVTPLVLGFAGLPQVGQAGLAEGCGAVAGGLLVALWGGPRHRRMIWLLNATVVAGLAVIAIGLRPAMPLVWAGIFTSAFALGVSGGIYLTIIQVTFPQRLHGRIIGLGQTLGWAAVPLAQAVLVPASGMLNPLLTRDGALAGSVGAVIGTGPGRGIGLAYVIFGLLLVIWTLLALCVRSLTHFDREAPQAAPDLTPEEKS